MSHRTPVSGARYRVTAVHDGSDSSDVWTWASMVEAVCDMVEIGRAGQTWTIEEVSA